MNVGKNILVTGGAGFIGSNLVGALLNDQRVNKVRVLDNLETGFKENIIEYINNPKFEFVKGDIRDYETCLRACNGMDLISHQAAIGSVPRSIKDPITTNNSNITGTLNVFNAAVQNSIRRVVFAASSSTYGDSKDLPKKEDNIGTPLSPYAVTKLVNELYAKVFADTYNFEFIGLRYFNVFGPKQDPFGAYAAVIPLFVKASLERKPPFINGDGSFSRDFTYIKNVIQANMNSLFTTNEKALNNIYNVACGKRTTLNTLWETICELNGHYIEPIYRESRAGDIPHSWADISKANTNLKYHPKFDLKEGLIESLNWYKKALSKKEFN